MLPEEDLHVQVQLACFLDLVQGLGPEFFIIIFIKRNAKLAVCVKVFLTFSLSPLHLSLPYISLSLSLHLSLDRKSVV